MTSCLLYVYNTASLTVNLCMDIMIASIPGLWWMVLHKLGVHVTFPVTVSTRYMPNSELAGSYSTFVFRFLRNLHPVFCSASYETAFLAEAKEGSLCSWPSPASIHGTELDVYQTNRRKVIYPCHFDCCYCCSVAWWCATNWGPISAARQSSYFLEFPQTHVHWVGDAIEPFHPLSSPSPPTFNLSQNQGIFSSESALCIRWLKYWCFSFSISPCVNIQGWFPLGLTGLISLQTKGTLKSLLQHHNLEFFGTQPSLWSNCPINTWLLEKP